MSQGFKLAPMLEALVDEFGARVVLEALGNVCGEKHEHVMNWQDEELAARWLSLSVALEELAPSARGL